jgi:diguanylate cyclase (GGDEF)-like protein
MEERGQQPVPPVAQPSLPISPLRGLLEVTRLLRAEEELPELLAAVARTVGESLGYRCVAVNLYRPEWDDFCVTAVHGSEQARAALLGRVRTVEDWEPLLDERFLQHGAFVLPAGSIDWDAVGGAYVPDVEPHGTGPDAWQPQDALFVPMRGADGQMLGVLSIDEPAGGRRPTGQELEVLVALADHAALAVEAAQEAREAARHRRALEELLSVSSGLTGQVSTEEILRRVCTGIRDSLGFHNVCAALVDPRDGRLVPRAAVGWRLDDPDLEGELLLADVQPLLDPAFETAGCYLLPDEEAERRISSGMNVYASELNGRGPRAWDRHWLLVPLQAGEGSPLGVLWVDEPEDRLLPSGDRLQALRIFANEAAAAIVSAASLTELRFLADHDPLTRLLNRRAFVERLDGEVARATRYGRRFALVLCDLDGFKAVNDRYGHAAGDEALQTFGDVLQGVLRRPDDAFRIGGDEFALLLAEASEADARVVVDRARSLLAAAEDVRLAEVSASFGCASCPEHAAEAHALFRLADEALYQAKRSGSGVAFAAAAP